MRRITSLSILFAALIEFAIERARLDLWIATAAIVTLSWNLVGRVLSIRSNWALRVGENMPDLLPDYEASVGSIHKMLARTRRAFGRRSTKDRGRNSATGK
jgi:hypothetical protein